MSEHAVVISPVLQLGGNDNTDIGRGAQQAMQAAGIGFDGGGDLVARARPIHESVGNAETRGDGHHLRRRQGGPVKSRSRPRCT